MNMPTLKVRQSDADWSVRSAWSDGRFQDATGSRSQAEAEQWIGAKSWLEPKAAERTQERPTEDDLARAALGGPKGAASLPPAPLTRQEEEQMSRSNDPGHVA